MGRRRKDNPLGLEKRVYAHHGQLFYVHRDGRWEPLGKDVEKANRRARAYNGETGKRGTVEYWFALYLAEAAAGRVIGAKGRPLRARTVEDYTEYAKPLCAYFGKMFPADIRPDQVVKYRRLRAQQGAPVVGNREKTALSALLTWLRAEHPEAGVGPNPCHRTGKNREQPRTRYVEDAEHRAVDALAAPMARAAMLLVYRTLQRPDDVLGWDRRNVVTKTFAGTSKRVLRFVQSKTGREMEIEITPELDAILAQLPALKLPSVGVPLICTRRRRRFTVDGIGSMIRRYCKRAGILSFGLQDMKAKGATDMYLAQVPLEVIQALCGHESKTTTEVYIKRHMTTIATPNQLALGGK